VGFGIFYESAFEREKARFKEPGPGFTADSRMAYLGVILCKNPEEFLEL
jgi:hypothetical protein